MSLVVSGFRVKPCSSHFRTLFPILYSFYGSINQTFVQRLIPVSLQKPLIVRYSEGVSEKGTRSAVRYVECPRDAWQGLAGFIPTEVKARHLDALLGAGFHTLDMGSFVSPKAVPQLADTEAVLAALPRSKEVNLLGIIANERGLTRAIGGRVTSVGYPLSINETFQQRNTGRSLADSWRLVEHLLRESNAHTLGFTVYLSMGFGNPYAEPWEPGDTAAAVARLRGLGVHDIALADTVGTATAARVDAVLSAIDEPAPLGLHLHARPDRWQDPLEVALSYGLRWFEGTLAGVGGCPFAADDLTGNLPTEEVIPFLAARGLHTTIQTDKLPTLAEQAAALSTRYGIDAPRGTHQADSRSGSL